MAYAILGIPVFLLFFIFTWGAAPCWHFERLWRERFGERPNDSKMAEVGLAPPSRRQASFVAFLVISGLLLIFTWLLSTLTLTELLVITGISAVTGCGAGYVLHKLGSGNANINKYFRSL